MPRIAGRIDISKNEAILDAAIEAMGERGFGVSMEEIARRAGVSKQTIYNHFGSKAEIARAMADRRVAEVTASLAGPDAEAFPEKALAEYGRALLRVLLSERMLLLMRVGVAGAAEAPEVSRAMYEFGTRASRARLAAFLEMEHATGRICAPDPMQAAEMFGGMVLGSHQIAVLLGARRPINEAEIDATATEAARRFMRAYAP